MKECAKKEPGEKLRKIVRKKVAWNCTIKYAGKKHETRKTRMSGLGIRHTVQLAPSAHLTSAAARHDLVHDVLPGHLHSIPSESPYVDQALQCWQPGHHTNPPHVDAVKIQQSWDFP